MSCMYFGVSPPIILLQESIFCYLNPTTNVWSPSCNSSQIYISNLIWGPNLQWTIYLTRQKLKRVLTFSDPVYFSCWLDRRNSKRQKWILAFKKWKLKQFWICRCSPKCNLGIPLINWYYSQSIAIYVFFKQLLETEFVKSDIFPPRTVHIHTSIIWLKYVVNLETKA